MRASLAAPAADRMSSITTWFAWGLGGAFFTLVALPLASSSPYPTPSAQDWSIPQSHVADASSFALASASSELVSGESVPLVTAVKTLSIKRPIGEDPEPDAPIVTASVGGVPTAEPAYPPRLTSAPSSTDDEDAAEPRTTPGASEIDDYLWEVYQRQPVKKDSGGDFSWKDPAAAKRMGKTLESYVILGMDTDFREIVYYAGKAMDAAGIEWHIVSAFRDDWRQSIASGIKARTGYSRHGGSFAVGGYGHGRAVDVGHIDRDRNDEVWRWIDANGAKYGLHRPFRSFDPPHVEPRGDWRRLAANLRREHTGLAAVAAADTETRNDATSSVVRSVSTKRTKKGRTVRTARVAYSRGKPARRR